MALLTAVGIVQPTYIGGYNLALNPATIAETPFRAETAERMSDAFTVIDRPYLLLGSNPDAAPFPPDVVQKMAWQLAWPSVNTNDYKTFAKIESLPGFFDFCPWKPIMETFSGNGVQVNFAMLRRRADTILTPPTGVTWTPTIEINGAAGTLPTFGTPDPTRGFTPLTFAAAPSGASASNVSLFYVPLYKVRVVSPARSYDAIRGFSESRTLTLEEI